MSDSKLVQIPRIMICAPCSGSGKTLVTCALLRLLSKKGYRVASFKCGPDYIDPMFHKKVLGLPSRNLDLFLAGTEGVRNSITANGKDFDISVIEGVMGLYDGMGASSIDGSSYDLCLQTETPAILVVNARGMSRSVIALIKGFCDYDAELTGKAKDRHNSGRRIQGIILNNISPMIAGEISDEIEKEVGIPVIGFLPKLDTDIFTSRHLGLVMPDEVPDILDKLDIVADKLSEHLDIDKLMEIACLAEPLLTGESCNLSGRETYGQIEEIRCSYKKSADKQTEDDRCGFEIKKENFYKRPVVGVALDEAFCFYYDDNLDLLQEMGAELKFFSPIHDKEIPDVDRLLIGGGYPELFAKELSENKSMLDSIRKAAEDGMPIIAECGGFLYLQKELTDTSGKTYEMAGVLDGSSHMTNKLSHFGYVEVKAQNENPYLELGQCIRGHEFHYYDTTDNGQVCKMVKPSGKRSWMGGQLKGNVFGAFVHLYYPSNPEFVRSFLTR